MMTAEQDTFVTTDNGGVVSTEETKYTSITAQTNLKIIYFIIGSVGLMGNLMVIVVILNSKSMLKSFTNRFILNQSFCDGVVAIILILSSAFEDTGRRLSGTADELYCRLWLTKMLLWGTLVSSTYNLVAMSVERYLAVVHPIWHKMSFTTAQFAAAVAFVWIIGTGYNMAYMIPSTQIQDGSCNLYAVWPSVTTQRAIGVFTIFLQFFIPLGILAFCYMRMALVLKRRVHPSSTDKASTKRVDSMARARKNIFKTLALVSVSFILCWIWNQVYFLLFNLGYKLIDFQSNFYHFTVVAVFCNCCINPFIYMIKYEQFQRGLRKLFFKSYQGGVTDMSVIAQSTAK